MLSCTFLVMANNMSKVKCSECSEPRYRFLMPSNRVHQIYLYCFSKSVERMPVHIIDGICHGCAAGSVASCHHFGCYVSQTFSSEPMKVDRDWIERSASELCKFEGQPAPVMHEHEEMLWNKCQNQWRPLVRVAVMHHFEMFSEWWAKCI